MQTQLPPPSRNPVATPPAPLQAATTHAAAPSPLISVEASAADAAAQLAQHSELDEQPTMPAMVSATAPCYTGDEILQDDRLETAWEPTWKLMWLYPQERAAATWAMRLFIIFTTVALLVVMGLVVANTLLR